MQLSQQLSKHFRDFYFGNNWTSVNLKETLSGVDWQLATRKIHNLNSIAVLVYHMNYFVIALRGVLENGILDAHDKFSFDLPPIRSEEDWQGLLEAVWAEAEKVTELIGALPDQKLSENFTDKKYGSFYRNIAGTIEHNHYHLGQIVVIKKILLQTVSAG